MKRNRYNIIHFLIALFCVTVLLGQETKVASSFISRIETGHYESAYEMVENDFKQKLSKDRFIKVWETVFAQLGKIEGYAFNCFIEKGDRISNFYKVSFEKSIVNIEVKVIEGDKIGGFFIVQDVPCNSGYLLPSYGNVNHYMDNNVLISDNDLKIQASIMEPKSYNSEIICILLSGSGPQDLDASIGPNKPLKDIAIGLAINGISSIRYNKANLISSKNIDSLTVDNEYTEAVISIISYLKKTNKLKTNKIVLIGHSLGGITAPFIAEKLDQIDGVIIMAGSPRALEDLILEQTNYLVNSSMSSNSGSRDSIINSMRLKRDNVKKDLSKNYISKENLPLSLPQEYWKSIKKYTLESKKNRRLIRKIKVPIYILWGEKDYQVTQQDFDLYKSLLKEKATYASYENLNHLFHVSNGSMLPSEYTIPGNIPEYIINDIVTWLKKITK